MANQRKKKHFILSFLLSRLIQPSRVERHTIQDQTVSAKSQRNIQSTGHDGQVVIPADTRHGP